MDSLEHILINITMSDYISFTSLILALIAFLYSYLTNTKKFEISNQYRSELLKWHSETIDILTRLRIETSQGFKDSNLKNELLSKLSSNIESGRFFFPNVDLKDNFGNSKPKAYRGYRHIMLDFLVFSYRLYLKDDASKYLNHAEVLQKHFTSQLFEIIDPHSFLRDLKRHAGKTFGDKMTAEKYIESNVNSIDIYINE